MLIIFQALFVLFVLFILFSVWQKRKEGLLGPKGMVFWIIFWLAVGTVVVWPNIVQKIADNFGIGRGADFVIYISIAVIFYLLFKLHVKVEGLRRDLTVIARKDALEGEKQSTQNK